MRISKKTDYALRVLFSLLDRREQGPISMTELARRNDVPKRFLEHIMLDLKKQGWVASTLGRRGGYVLSKDPAEITMGQVVRCFGGLAAPTMTDGSSLEASRNRSPFARFRRVFLEIRNMTAKLMDQATLASVYANEPFASRDLVAQEMTDGDGI